MTERATSVELLSSRASFPDCLPVEPPNLLGKAIAEQETLFLDELREAGTFSVFGPDMNRQAYEIVAPTLACTALVIVKV